MESCSKELTLAIKLTKILSVSSKQGKENVNANPTREFFQEVKEHLGSEVPAHILVKTLFFLYRLTQKSYTQLLVTEQEYAIWLALHVLHRNTWCKALISKTALLALKVITNLTLYLQQQELITEEEKMSWQRCEKLLSFTLLFIHKGETFIPIDCPSFLEQAFPAYFISAVPEDFTMAYIESTVPSAQFNLFDESYGATKTFLNYILQVLGQTPYPTPLVSTLLSLLGTCPRIAETDLLISVVESFKSWFSVTSDYIHSAKLLILLAKLNPCHSTIQKQVFQILSTLLELNEQNIKEKNQSLIPLDLLTDLCTVIVENLSSISESPKQPQNVNVAGFGKEKYEEEDTSTEEFCSFNRTRTNYEMQHWYYCYSCKLVGNRGMCSVCARKCHKGHEVVYSRRANFFCDCGANQGNSTCKSMPKGARRKNISARLLNREDLEYGMGSSLEIRDFLDKENYFNEGPRSLLIPSQALPGSMLNFDDYSPDLHDMPEFSISSPHLDMQSDDEPSRSEDKKDFDELDDEEDDEEDKEEILIDMDVEDSESELKPSSKSSVEVKKPKNEVQVLSRQFTLDTFPAVFELVKRTLLELELEQELKEIREPWTHLLSKKPIESSRNLSKHLCNFKSFSSLKSSYSEHKELKDIASRYPGCRSSLAYCPELNLILMAEGNKLISVDSSLFHTTSTEIDRSNIQYLCKHVFSFHILSVTRNPDNSRLLVVAGATSLSCILLCSKQHRGYIEKKITISVTNNENSRKVITKVKWVPRSQTILAVCTNEDLKIFDLSKDIQIPLQVFRSIENDLTDMIIDHQTFLVSSSKGNLFREPLQIYNETRYLQEAVSLSSYIESGYKISSMEWLDLHRLLFINISGKILIIRPDLDLRNALTEICIDLASDANLSSQICGISNIISLPSEDSLVCVGISRKVSASPVLLKIAENKIVIHSLKKSVGYADGICLYNQANKNILLVQNDDGSLVTHSIFKDEDVGLTNIDLEAVNSWLQLGYLPKSVRMSVTFFEKCIALNGMRVWGGPGGNKYEVVLSGDPVQIFGSSKLAIEKLTHDRNNENPGLISSMLADPKTVTLTVALEGNSFNSLLLAGFKVFMEAGSGSYIEVLNRKVTPVLGQKRWYDIPLTEVEILKVYLQKSVTIKIHTPNPGRYPIRLFSFEIFAINQSGYSLEQKLGELARIQNGSANVQATPVLYKYQSWKNRFSMLENQSCKSLVVFLNTLACTNLQVCDELLENVARVALQVFSSKVNVGIAALRQALKGLLVAMEYGFVYLGAKALVMCWSLANTSLPSEECCKIALKTLCRLYESSSTMFCYIMQCYPGTLQILNEHMMPNNKLKMIEQFLSFIFAVTELQVCSYSSDIFISLLSTENIFFKEQVIQKTFSILKKLQTSPGLLSSPVGGFLPADNIVTQLIQIFSIKEVPERNSYSLNLVKSLLEALCKDWSGELCKVNGILSLLHKLMLFLEKVFLRGELEPSFFTLITSALHREILKTDTSNNSQGRLFFLQFCNLLISYHRPKEEKYSKMRKMHKSVVLAFLNSFDSDILNTVLQKLQLLVWKFKNGQGSQWAVYHHEFLVEVAEGNSLARLTEPEDPLLANEWEGTIDSEVFEQPNDQFFMQNLLDFAYNLMTVVEGEEMTELNFTVNDDWKALLLEIILEPSLQFVKNTSESLLELLCDRTADYLCTLNRAKIQHHFSIIRKASSRNNYFKNFKYNESLFLLKEFKAIQDCIRNSEASWKEISCHFTIYHEFIQTFILIALNLNDQASEECLSIVNKVLSVQDRSPELEFSVSVLWEQFLEAVIPNLMSKLTLTGNPELSKQSADLLNNVSLKASEKVCRKIEEIMLHYFEALPNLGSNSFYFIMNFMTIAGNSVYNQDLKDKFSRGVIKGLENSCKQLSSNIDNQTYGELQKLFSKYGFHWFLLEREPCLKCFDTNYTNLEQVKINDLQSEMRFSENAYFVRFKNPIKVSRISIKISEIRGQKAVVGVSLYFCNTNNRDLADLKHNNEIWALIKTVKVKPASSNTLDIDLDIPTIMLNLKVKFQTVAVIRMIQEDFPHFYQPRYVAPRGRYSLLSGKKFDGKGNVVGISIGNDKELMTCPRCSKTVEDRYGLCTCGENANQCFKCRNINYESLDAFLCNECGEGRYSKVDIFIKYTLDAICESVTTEAEAQELAKEVDGHLGIIQNYYENLPKYREILNSFIAKYKGESSKKELKEESGKELSPVLYSLINTVREYQDSYYSMMISVKSVALLRTAIMNYSSYSSSNVSSQDTLTTCYGCNFSFVSNLLKGLISLKNPSLIQILISQYNIIETTVQYIIHSYSQKLKKKGKKLIIHLALQDEKAIKRLYNIVDSHLETVMRFQSYFEPSVLDEIQLVLDFTCEYFSQKLNLEDPHSEEVWNSVLKQFWKIFFIILDKSWEDSKVSNTLALFLDMILDMIFKTLILKPGCIQEDLDAATLDFFLNNPALFKNIESETNSNDLFLKSIQIPGLAGLYDDWQGGSTSFASWKARVESSATSSSTVKIPQNWLLDCLLYSTSVRVQDMSRMIICCLAGSGLWSDCLYLMLELLPEALSICHQGADYYFTVLSKLLEDFKENHEFILEVLLTETFKSVQDILAQQEKARIRGAFVVNISLGHGLACLLHLLTDLSENWGRHLLNNQKLANLIINSFLNVRKIQFVKNKVISESQEYLEKLFDHLHMDCSEDQRLNFLQECVKALIGINNDVLAQVFLVQQIIRVVEPTKPEPVYYLRLEKSMTQEEFIRGNIEKNPYSSTEIGPLMADVRKRICKDLELSDPDLLELLVAGQIISPNLKIHQVYENIHWPHVKPSNSKFLNKNLNDLNPEELPQMVITFRLAGLDGEATEDIVDTLPGDDLNKIDPEVKYGITKTLAGGAFGYKPMQYLLELLAEGSQDLTCSVLTLLFYSCQISTNREALCQVGGVPVLLKMMNTSQKSTEQLLKILEKLISDPRCQPYISSTSDSISLILGLLKSHQSSLMEISPILPFLCQDNPEACSILVDYFRSHIKINELFNSTLPEAANHIENMLESLKSSHSTLRDSFLASGVTKALCDVLGLIDVHSRPEVTRFLLKVIKGLVRSHYSSQQLLSPKVIEKIFKMKNEANGIGPCAECLIEAVLQDREKANPAVADLLQIMTSNEDEQRRDKALKKKEEILKQFQVVSSFEMTLEEEDGLTCVICKEGYKLRPDDLLGFYIFVSSVPQNTSTGDLLHIMSLVTHFNAIHLQCHKEAARAEKSMRKPKTEWEGATIRNQHTKCNNWFPIWGPQIPKHDYASGVQWMFSSYSTVDSRFVNEVYDLKLILEKFAYEESFSRESRGGGPEHNMQAIPYLVQMICFLMEEEKEQAESFAAEIKEMTHRLSAVKPGIVFLNLAAQIFVGSFNDWKTLRVEWIKKTWNVAKSFPRNEVRVHCFFNGVEASNEQKMVLSCFKAFLVSFRIVDLVFNVLFAGSPDLAAAKVFLQSASEEIQERSLFIYEDYKRMAALQSVQDMLSHLGTEFNVSMFS